MQPDSLEDGFGRRARPVGLCAADDWVSPRRLCPVPALPASHAGMVLHARCATGLHVLRGCSSWVTWLRTCPPSELNTAAKLYTPIRHSPMTARDQSEFWVLDLT